MLKLLWPSCKPCSASASSTLLLNHAILLLKLRWLPTSIFKIILFATRIKRQLSKIKPRLVLQLHFKKSALLSGKIFEDKAEWKS